MSVVDQLIPAALLSFDGLNRSSLLQVDGSMHGTVSSELARKHAKRSFQKLSLAASVLTCSTTECAALRFVWKQTLANLGKYLDQNTKHGLLRWPLHTSGVADFCFLPVSGEFFQVLETQNSCFEFARAKADCPIKI